MDDQLDEELKNRIKKVFEDYHDPSADEGWLLLREKFPEEKRNRRGLIWFWWGAAALLVLSLGFGLWKYSANTQSGQLAHNVKPAPAKNENLVAGKKNASATTVTQSAPVQPAPKTAGEQVAATHFIARSGLYTPPVIRSFIPAKAGLATRDSAAKPLLAAQSTGNNNNVVKQLNTNAIAANKIDSVKRIINQGPANYLAITPGNAPVKTNPASQLAVVPGNAPVKTTSDTAKAVKKPKDIGTMFASQTYPEDKMGPKQSRVRFGIYAGSFVNYAKGSGNQSNLGGGVSAEIKIAKNLKLVTGVAVAGNSLSFGGGVPSGAVQSNFFASQQVPGAAATSPNTLSAFSLNSASTVTSASVPAFKNYGASLVNIDVPVNLKYEFNPKKINLYVMTGLSSGTFLNEKYTYQYNYPAIHSPTLQQTQAETATKSFNSFYVGKMVNFAVGFGYPLGGYHIIVEPFLKYPLDGLGSQNIRFGAGGINLKFNFPGSGK